MTNKSTEQYEPRAMLAVIALATEVPTPKSISIYPKSEILSLMFERLAHGLAWSAFLGGQTETYVNTDGRRYLDAGVIRWHGWSVQLHASEAADDETDETPLAEDVAERLAALAAPSQQPALVVVDVDDCAREVVAALSGPQ